MKLLILALYLIPSQCMIALPPLPAPVTTSLMEIPIDAEWECPSCGHVNGDWTGYCYKCGRRCTPEAESAAL